MDFFCPKCGKKIDMSPEELIRLNYSTVCPRCLSDLRIIGEYAYIPTDDTPLDNNIEPQTNTITDTITEPEPMQTEFEPETHTNEQSPATTAPPPISNTPPPLNLDPLFDAAVEYIKTCNAITPLMLQNYFNIDAQRAQTLINQLEQQGIIGPFNNFKPRTILIPHNNGLPNVVYKPQYNATPAQGYPLNSPPQNSPPAKSGPSGCTIFLIILIFIWILAMIAH